MTLNHILLVMLSNGSKFWVILELQLTYKISFLFLFHYSIKKNKNLKHPHEKAVLGNEYVITHKSVFDEGSKCNCSRFTSRPFELHRLMLWATCLSKLIIFLGRAITTGFVFTASVQALEK